MAFLDNSGTIILDAILTDLGRKRMAEGKFKISKFALGDDEIDYSLVDVENSDFSKLETLSATEALNAENATINYGLEDYTSDDIFYVPQLKINELLDFSVKKHSSNDDFYYLSVNGETSDKLKTVLGSTEFYLENGAFFRNKFVFESGIDNDNLVRNQLARERYILCSSIKNK